MILINFLYKIRFRLKSSHYDLNILGYTRITMVKTKGNYFVNLSQSLKIIVVRITF